MRRAALASSLVRTRDLFDLSGKTAIVTGGSVGLGRHMADALAEFGANVAICARKAERCELAAAEIEEEYSVGTFGMGCDVRVPEQVEAVVERAQQQLGGVDILVNNAGVSWVASPESLALEGWQKVIDVNLTGSFLFAQAAGRRMIEAGGGKIVNIASVLAVHGIAPEGLDALPYNTAKGGIVNFTRDLAVKWARHNIHVNAIAPGWFPTDMSDSTLEN